MKVSNIVDTSSINKYSDIPSSNNVKDHPNTSDITNGFSNEDVKKTLQLTVNKLNQFAEIQNRNSKFVFHDGLKQYYVEVVDAQTNEVIKEIPPKKILDTYYEMQKILGKVIDKTI